MQYVFPAAILYKGQQDDITLYLIIVQFLKKVKYFLTFIVFLQMHDVLL